MSETIVLIFEGARTEPRILSSILRVFFANNPSRIVHATYDTDLYDLYDEVRSDEALDIIELLRERNERNGERLEGLDIDDISQIFLFFDYDGHATKATDEKIEEMVSFFDNETEEGKLYVSYPMVESLKDFGDTHSNETNFVEAKRPIGYKKLVGDRTKYHDYRKLDRPIWNYMAYARNILEKLPYENMTPDDGLLTGSAKRGDVLAQKGEVYAVYLPDASQGGILNMVGATGVFKVQWYNPRTGNIEGQDQTVNGGGAVDLGAAPKENVEDWVVLLTKNGIENGGWENNPIPEEEGEGGNEGEGNGGGNGGAGGGGGNGRCEVGETEFAFEPMLKVRGDGCAPTRRRPEDPRTITVPEAGDYKISAYVHRGTPGQIQTNESYSIKAGGVKGNVLPDDPDPNAVTKRLEKTGVFPLKAGENTVTMLTGSSCPPDKHINSVEIEYYCVKPLGQALKTLTFDTAGTKKFPEKFSPPWNIFSQAKESLVRVTSFDRSLSFFLGNVHPSHVVWHKAYISLGGGAWREIMLTGENVLSGDSRYLSGEAITNVSLSVDDLGRGNSIASYQCSYINNQWKCGCNEKGECSMWTLQKFEK